MLARASRHRPVIDAGRQPADEVQARIMRLDVEQPAQVLAGCVHQRGLPFLIQPARQADVPREMSFSQKP